MKRVAGLDTIRFALAFIVLLGHGGLPHIDESLIVPSRIFYYLDIIMKLFQPVGVAAVMGFFVVSGFAIHLPYSQSITGLERGKSLNILEFYSRRFVRIAIPATVAICIYHFTFGLFMGVIWSLICELIYYLLYPLILKYKKMYMKQILIGTFIASYMVTILYSVTANGYSGDVHRQGFYLTWIVGLPVWLLGVVLADQYEDIKKAGKNISFSRITVIRVAVWLAADFAAVLRFQGHIAYGYTLPVFAVFAYYWLKQEIAYYLNKKENRVLQFGGEMSYSLYLIHTLVLFAVGYYTNTEVHHSMNGWLCVLAIVLSLLASWIFYLLVEKPSHKLARSIKIRKNNL
ncbi:hypothetical protein FACS1894182_11330 [Bacteroidia bacterium]|nr:hypothetical protein FACS1894182_11330 [Bacteroidia bacterium]